MKRASFSLFVFPCNQTSFPHYFCLGFWVLWRSFLAYFDFSKAELLLLVKWLPRKIFRNEPFLFRKQSLDQMQYRTVHEEEYLVKRLKTRGKNSVGTCLLSHNFFPMLTKNKKEHIIVLEKYPQGRFLTWSEKYTSEKLSCGAWIVLFHALLYQWPKCSFVVKQ